MGEMDEIIRDFLVESYENLDQLDQDFIALEGDPTQLDILASIFRTIHTIKGTCGFLGFSKLEKVAHAGENLLSKLRDGEMQLTPAITNSLLEMVDAVRAMLDNIEAERTEGEKEYAPLIERLEKHTAGEAVDDDAPSAEPEAVGEEIDADGAAAPSINGFASTYVDQEAALAQKQAAEADGESEDESAEPVDAEAPVEPEPPAEPEEDEPEEEGTPEDAPPAGEKTLLLDSEDEQKAAAEAAKSASMTRSGGSVADATIRVDVDLLDRLMNLVGELVLARNQVLQLTSGMEDRAFLSSAQHLDHITSELQEGLMKTRMQPIGNVWSRFPRVVRDLARSCGKQIKLEMEGKETELDRTLVEAIKDPLTHVVRNAVDHGVETPQERVAAGKPAEGTLWLRAYHEGGLVNIEISDDGGGIDAEKVARKAVDRGVITRDQASRMTEREAVNLIFSPGFSTAEKVTNISGRGVGMDVVKTNIEKIGGTVDIQSVLGKGTTLKIKIPLTLAIVPALVVTSGGERFAIPQVSLVELVTLEGTEAKNAIEMIYGTPVYRLRGNLLPLVFLNRELRITPESEEAGAEGVAAELAAEADSATEAAEMLVSRYASVDEDEVEKFNIVVLQADERQFGLVVDEINDSQEIVVKPLGKQIKDIDCFAGATIMGDGRVALILDVLGLAQRTRIVSEVKGQQTRLVAGEREEAGKEELHTLLVFRSPDDGRMAMELSSVTRLEEFRLSEIERAGGHEMIQYRGEIMPLIDVFNIIPERRKISRGDGVEEEDLRQVVVYSENGRSIGLVVGQILDIVEQPMTVKGRSSRSGVHATIVIQDKVTELLDVKEIIRTADPMFFRQTAET